MSGYRRTRSTHMLWDRRDVLRLPSLAVAGSALPLWAQNGSPEAGAQDVRLDPKRIESTLSSMVDSGRTAGASLLVWKDGREAYFGAAGFADREARRPMARDTIVQIYSMTKPVTGVALMQLWEQGKFGVDDLLSRYLPDFQSIQVYGGKDAAGSPVYHAP